MGAAGRYTHAIIFAIFARIEGAGMLNFLFHSAGAAAAFLVVGAALAGGASAEPGGGLAFRTPSNNIHCQAELPFSPGESTILRCDVMQRDNPDPPRPRDCEYDWGMAFYIEDRDVPAQRMCAGDSARHEGPVLGYGKTWRGAGFECVSQRDGLTCRNGTGHGFKLSRKSQQLF